MNSVYVTVFEFIFWTLQVVVDSTIISDLLGELTPEKPLYPENPFTKAQQKMLAENWSGNVREFYRLACFSIMYIEFTTELITLFWIFTSIKSMLFTCHKIL